MLGNSTPTMGNESVAHIDTVIDITVAGVLQTQRNGDEHCIISLEENAARRRMFTFNVDVNQSFPFDVVLVTESFEFSPDCWRRVVHQLRRAGFGRSSLKSLTDTPVLVNGEMYKMNLFPIDQELLMLDAIRKIVERSTFRQVDVLYQVYLTPIGTSKPIKQPLLGQRYSH